MRKRSAPPEPPRAAGPGTALGQSQDTLPDTPASDPQSQPQQQPQSQLQQQPQSQLQQQQSQPKQQQSQQQPQQQQSQPQQQQLQFYQLQPHQPQPQQQSQPRTQPQQSQLQQQQPQPKQQHSQQQQQQSQPQQQQSHPHQSQPQQQSQLRTQPQQQSQSQLQSALQSAPQSAPQSQLRVQLQLQPQLHSQSQSKTQSQDGGLLTEAVLAEIRSQRKDFRETYARIESRLDKLERAFTTSRTVLGSRRQSVDENTEYILGDVESMEIIVNLGGAGPPFTVTRRDLPPEPGGRETPPLAKADTYRWVIGPDGRLRPQRSSLQWRRGSSAIRVDQPAAAPPALEAGHRGARADSSLTSPASLATPTLAAKPPAVRQNECLVLFPSRQPVMPAPSSSLSVWQSTVDSSRARPAETPSVMRVNCADPGKQDIQIQVPGTKTVRVVTPQEEIDDSLLQLSDALPAPRARGSRAPPSRESVENSTSPALSPAQRKPPRWYRMTTPVMQTNRFSSGRFRHDLALQPLDSLRSCLDCVNVRPLSVQDRPQRGSSPIRLTISRDHMQDDARNGDRCKSSSRRRRPAPQVCLLTGQEATDNRSSLRKELLIHRPAKDQSVHRNPSSYGVPSNPELDELEEIGCRSKSNIQLAKIYATTDVTGSSQWADTGPSIHTEGRHHPLRHLPTCPEYSDKGKTLETLFESHRPRRQSREEPVGDRPKTATRNNHLADIHEYVRAISKMERPFVIRNSLRDQDRDDKRATGAHRATSRREHQVKHRRRRKGEETSPEEQSSEQRNSTFCSFFCKYCQRLRQIL